MRVELVDPPAGVHMDPVVIPADQVAAVATIVGDKEMALPPAAQLRFRGIGELPRDVKVVSEILLSLTRE